LGTSNGNKMVGMVMAVMLPEILLLIHLPIPLLLVPIVVAVDLVPLVNVVANMVGVELVVTIVQVVPILLHHHLQPIPLHRPIPLLLVPIVVDMDLVQVVNVAANMDGVELVLNIVPEGLLLLLPLLLLTVVDVDLVQLVNVAANMVGVDLVVNTVIVMPLIPVVSRKPILNLVFPLKVPFLSLLDPPRPAHRFPDGLLLC